MHGFTILCCITELDHSSSVSKHMDKHQQIKVIKVTKEVDIPHNTLPKQKKGNSSAKKYIV